MERTLKVLERDLIIIKDGLEAVRELMDDSFGVCGLHLNGDTAMWGELEESGHFEDWLLPFNIAEDKISELVDAKGKK